MARRRIHKNVPEVCGTNRAEYTVMLVGLALALAVVYTVFVVGLSLGPFFEAFRGHLLVR